MNKIKCAVRPLSEVKNGDKNKKTIEINASETRRTKNEEFSTHPACE